MGRQIGGAYPGREDHLTSLVSPNPPEISTDRSRRVALLTAAGPWSGVEVHTLSLAQALQAAGHSAVIVELGRDVYRNRPQDNPECKVVSLQLGSGPAAPMDDVSFFTWRRLFRSVECETAISVKGTFNFGTLTMEAAARSVFKRFMVIEHLHSPLGPRRSNRYLGGRLPGLGLWWIKGRMAGRARSIFPQRVICVSSALAETLRQDYGYPPSKLITAYSGVDPGRFCPSQTARDSARAGWKVPDSALVFGTIGRVSRMKNHAQLVRAFARLRAAEPGADLRLVIVGEGPESHSIKALADSLGLGNSIILAGFQPRPELVAPGFDVFCFPSLTGESLGLALLEAMACGVPAIASTVGGVPEILTDTNTGWLIPPDDEDLLMHAMHAASAVGREKLENMGTAARAHVVANFNAAEKWRDLVDVICA